MSAFSPSADPPGMLSSTNPAPRIAAVVPNGTVDIDALISAFARDLIAQGWRVGGLVQEFLADGPNCEVTLVDVAAGTRYSISQKLGSQSAACRLDPGALAEASIVMRRIADEGADLAIFNRFAAMEAAGDGLAAEMLALMSDDIPVLTVVQQKHLTAWRHFTGGLAAELEPRREVLDSWFFATREAPPSAP
jgi:hypothetical protein